jgi:HK97 family phage major capsid protein
MSGVMNNKDLLAKADLALSDLVSDGGILVSAQARQFIKLLIQEAVILKLAKVVTMKSHKQLIEGTKLGSRVLRAAQERTALAEADRSSPDLTKVELDAKLFKGEIQLSYETLEDSIERAAFQKTVMGLMAEAVARDMDEVIIQGDTTSSDTFLKQFDGLLVQANQNQVNALDNTLTKSVLRQTLKALPGEYMRIKKQLTFLTSKDAALDYTDSLGDRQTTVGDEKLLRGGMSMYSGIPVIDVPLFPEDIASTVADSSELTTNVILTSPKNMNVGIWRQVRIETDKFIREGTLVIVVTVRFDMKLAEAEAAAKAYNVAFASL